MNHRNLIILSLLALFFSACSGDTKLIYLIQNQHPSLDTLDVCIAYISKESKGGECGKLGEKDSLIWSGRIAYSENPKTAYIKMVPLVELSKRSNCCLQVNISYHGDLIHRGSGSWINGTTYEHIVISKQSTGAYFVNSLSTAEPPKNYEELKLIPLDEETKQFLEKK